MSKVLLLLALCAWSVAARAQAAAGVLVEMASHAGVIFSGVVLSVARHDAAGFVEIQFRVDVPVRGCTAGQAYTLREWSGRWAGHSERYRAGQQLLMLLTPPGPAGLSAPVYGGDGALPIVAGASGSLGDIGVAAEPVVDLRLLATRVQPEAATPTRPNLLILAPIAMDDSAAVWPALANILALLRGGTLAPR